VGKPADAVAAIVDARQKAGLIVRTETQFDLAGAQQFSYVWWKPDRLPDLNQTNSGMEEAVYNSLVFPSNPQVDVRLDGAPAVLPPPRLHQNQLAALPRSDDVEARFKRGWLNFYRGKAEDAVADLDQVVARAPQLTFAYFWRALARARQGKATEARQDLAAFQKQVGGAGWAFALNVAVSAYLGEEADAVKRLEAALPEHADDPDFRYKAALGYTAARQALLTSGPDQARAYGDRAVAPLRQVAAGGFVYGYVFSYRDLLAYWPQETLADHTGFQELLRGGHLEQNFSAVWNDTAERESAESHGLDPARHLQRCRELAAAGYRPATVSVLWPGEREPPETASAWNRPVVPEAVREARARRQAQVAVTLLQLGQPERVWPLLVHRPDPRVRSYLVHDFGPLKTDPGVLAKRLDQEPDLSARRALILALGQFPGDALSAAVRDPLADRLLVSYRDDPDPGLHAATGRLPRSRAWGQAEKVKELNNSLKGATPAGKAGEPRWVVNTKVQTLVVLPGPVEFWMGSPAGETDREDNERLHRERIPRSFAIGEREVTMAEFQEFW
jgi:tetratricopeptide (TPR) repeat protein